MRDVDDEFTDGADAKDSAAANATEDSWNEPTKRMRQGAWSCSKVFDERFIGKWKRIGARFRGGIVGAVGGMAAASDKNG